MVETDVLPAASNTGAPVAIPVSLLVEKPQNFTNLSALTGSEFVYAVTASGSKRKVSVALLVQDGGISAGHINNTNNPHSVTKAQVGLSNVDNTSDANKPVSSAQQAEIDRVASKIGGEFSFSAFPQDDFLTMLLTQSGSLVSGIKYLDGAVQMFLGDEQAAFKSEVAAARQELLDKITFSALDDPGDPLLLWMTQNGQPIFAVRGDGAIAAAGAPLGAAGFTQIVSNVPAPILISDMGGYVCLSNQDDPSWFLDFRGARARFLELRSNVRTVRSPMVTVPATAWAGYSSLRLHVLMGQSLAEGVGATPVIQSGPVSAGRVTMFAREQGSPNTNVALSERADSLFDTLTDLENVNIEIPVFGTAIKLLQQVSTNTAMHVFAAARGGYNYAQLKKNGSSFVYRNAWKGITRVIAGAVCSGRTVEGMTVSWIHGQADANDTEAQYLAKMVELQADLTHDYQALTGSTAQVLLVMTQNTPHNTNARVGVALGQLKADLDNPGKIILVGPIYHLNRTDGTHLTAQSSRRLSFHHGLAIARTLAGNEWQPLRMQSAVRTGASIVVNFIGGIGNITLDATAVRQMPNNGFDWIQTGGTPRTIASMAITGAKQITITLSGDPGAVTAQSLTLGVNGTGSTEGFTNNTPSNALGAATNIRTESNETDGEGFTLHDWACHQSIAVS